MKFKHWKMAALAMVLALATNWGAATAKAPNATLPTAAEYSTPVVSAQLLAQSFGETPVIQDNFLLVSAPGPTVDPHKFFIIEQQSNQRPCWNEVAPGEIDPLWTTFDFTGICGRFADSNGYGIRAAGEDLALSYTFRIEERDGDLVLYGIPKPTNRDKRRITVARSNGISSTGFTRLTLNPGWDLTRRTYNGQNLGYIYTSTGTTLATLLDESGEVVAQPPTTRPPVTPPRPAAPFPDIQGDQYASEIARASELGLIAGYEDGTFRPRNPVTREQAISIVMEAIYKIAPSTIVAGLPQQVYSAPFPDVAANRWSAIKINQAKQLGIVTGDFQTGRFRPADNVSRAELMAMLNKAARQIGARAREGVPGPATTTLPPTQSPINFTDISGHWGASVITEMSAFCGVATPLNETGTQFAPEMDALRNYTSAAIVRLVDCRTTGV